MFESWSQFFSVKRSVNCSKANHRQSLLFELTVHRRVQGIDYLLGAKSLCLIVPWSLLEISNVQYWRLRSTFKSSLIRILLPVFSNCWSFEPRSVQLYWLYSEKAGSVGVQALLEGNCEIFTFGRADVFEVDFDDASHDVSSFVGGQVDVDLKVILIFFLFDADVAIDCEDAWAVGGYFRGDRSSGMLQGESAGKLDWEAKFLHHQANVVGFYLLHKISL